MPSMPRVRWLRIVAGAFLAEAAVIAVFLLVLWIATLAGHPGIAQVGTTLDAAEAIVGSFASIFLFTLWVCRRVEGRFILHGVLVAVTAILMFVALWFAANRTFAESALYWVAHGCKIAGGVAGGVVAARGRRG